MVDHPGVSHALFSLEMSYEKGCYGNCFGHLVSKCPTAFLACGVQQRCTTNKALHNPLSTLY
eukprot:6454828-Amphidinium_carterae.1